MERHENGEAVVLPVLLRPVHCHCRTRETGGAGRSDRSRGTAGQTVLSRPGIFEATGCA